MKIVYSHIEKTAGTSFRVYLLGMLPKGSFFWFSEPQEPFPENDFFLYGGHRRASDFDKAVSPSVLLSLLREPHERVRSLHRYLVKQIRQRRADIESDPYCISGFDPRSIRNSILNCADFRARCQNVQALNFCTSNRDPLSRDLSSEALDYLMSRPCLIGVQENIDGFILQLVRLWSFSSIFPRENVSHPVTVERDSAEQSAEDRLIQEVCEQDMILYRNISMNGGLFRVTQKEARVDSLPPIFRREVIQRISLEIVGFPDQVIVDAGKIMDCVFRVRNRNPSSFGDWINLSVNLSYHIKDESGVVVVHDGIRTSLPRSIRECGDELFIVRVKFPSAPGEYLIEPALVIEGVSWVDEANGAQTCTSRVEVR